MISSKEKIEDNDDDQLFYTKIFLDENSRVKFDKINLIFVFCLILFRKNGRLYLINELKFL